MRVLSTSIPCSVVLFALLLMHSDGVNAIQPFNCTSRADRWLGTRPFGLRSWLNRGICVRQGGSFDGCYNAYSLIYGQNLDEPRKAEYTAATSVLVVLPTIGALLGAPTAEIWRLLTIIPFGGFLAMTMSFGGAILPVRVKDYETNANGQRTTVGRSVISTTNLLDNAESAEDKKIDYTDEVVRDIRMRIRQEESQRLAKGHFWLGLVGIFCLWGASQAVMVVVQQGAIVIFWCTSRYWMHVWYFLGKTST